MRYFRSRLIPDPDTDRGSLAWLAIFYFLGLGSGLAFYFFGI